MWFPCQSVTETEKLLSPTTENFRSWGREEEGEEKDDKFRKRKRKN
jgi:hypothetical protein